MCLVNDLNPWLVIFISADQAFQDLTIVTKTSQPWLETLPSHLKDHQVCGVVFGEGGVNVFFIASFKKLGGENNLRMRRTLRVADGAVVEVLVVIADTLFSLKLYVGMNKLDESIGMVRKKDESSWKSNHECRHE